jgi:glycosyltransferase involved in cell wall biosynthesis
MKLVLATGPGKLHFFDSAAALAGVGVEVNILTGWVPSKRQESLATIAGVLMGQPNLARRLAVRRMDLERVQVTANGWAEVLGTGLGILAGTGLIDKDVAAASAFRLVGWSNSKHLAGADVFQVRSGAGQGGAIQSARSNGLKTLADHSIAHPAYMRDLLEPEYHRLGMKCDLVPESPLWQLVIRDCQEADQVLVNSDFVKETFVQHGFNADKINVAYLGVQRAFFGLKKGYRLTNRVNILFTGHFDLRKGARVLLEAIRLVRSRGLDARLEIIGHMGTGRSCIQGSDSEFLTIKPFVPQDDLRIRMAESDLFAFPTFAEGSSRSAMEAMAAGLPVITTANCGLPAKHQITAYYVPVGNVVALADSIEELASNQTMRESLGSSGASLVAQHYTWDHYGRNVLKIFEGLTHGADAHLLRYH